METLATWAKKNFSKQIGIELGSMVFDSRPFSMPAVVLRIRVWADRRRAAEGLSLGLVLTGGKKPFFPGNVAYRSTRRHYVGMGIATRRRVRFTVA